MFIFKDTSEIHSIYLTDIERNPKNCLRTIGSSALNEAQKFKTKKEAVSYFMPLITEEHSSVNNWKLIKEPNTAVENKNYDRAMSYIK